MPGLIDPPVTFGHRGARAHAEDNTIDSFRLALRLGASGLESDVWLTADGEAVLDHDGVVRSGLRRRPISEVKRAALPSHIPTLDELYEVCGTGYELSLDVKDPAAAERVVTVARAVGGDALPRLWLCHHDWEVVAGWRSLDGGVRLVDSTRLRHMRENPERRAAALSAAGIDAVNMHHTDWTHGLTVLFHRFERVCFAWDAQHERIIRSLVKMEIDGIFSDHVDRLVEVVGAAT